MCSLPKKVYSNNNNVKESRERNVHSLCLPPKQMRWTAWDGVLSPEREKRKNRGRGLPLFYFYMPSLINVDTDNTNGQKLKMPKY